MTECGGQSSPEQHPTCSHQSEEVLTNFATNAGFSQVTTTDELQAEDIAHVVKSALEMHDRGFTTELTVFATNRRIRAHRHLRERCDRATCAGAWKSTFGALLVPETVGYGGGREQPADREKASRPRGNELAPSRCQGNRS